MAIDKNIVGAVLTAAMCVKASQEKRKDPSCDEVYNYISGAKLSCCL
jgi:hypothetical protein